MMHTLCLYCGTLKGTSRDKVTSNCNKIKPVALAVTELCLLEGIRQAVSQYKTPLTGADPGTNKGRGTNRLSFRWLKRARFSSSVMHI